MKNSLLPLPTMKNLYSRLALITSLTLITGYFIVSAAWTSMTNVTAGDSVSATLWNNLIGNVNDLNTRIGNIALWSNVIGGISYTGGNVGIGTTSPLTKLHIEDGAQIASFLGTTRGTFSLSSPYAANYYQAIDFLYTSNANPTARIGVKNTSGGTYLNFGTSNNYAGGITNTAMSIDPSGNVGIGTTTPGQKLSVAGIVESTSGGFKFPDGTTQTTAAVFPNLLSANGYQKLPGGLILQWGTYTATMSHTASYVVTFPIPFTATLNVINTVANTVNTGVTPTYVPVTAITASNFTFQYGSVNGLAYSTSARWFAIGY
ncbi:MAG: hypothetical protein WC774_04990 [Candidatus Gracilibacteria bacterium]